MLYKLIFGLFILSNILWATNYSMEQVEKWAKVGIKEKEISYCIHNDISIEDVIKWRAMAQPLMNGLSGINFCKEKGIKSPEAAYEWSASGVIDCQEAGEYTKINISPNEYSVWHKINSFLSKDKIIKLKKEYGSAEKFKKLLDEEMKILKDWEDAGVRDYYIDEWIRVGVQNPKKAAAWISNGFIKAYDAKDWIDAGVTNPKIAKSYYDAGVSYRDIKKDKKLSIEEINKWKSVGAIKVVKWKEININTSEKAKSWIEIVGDDPEYVNEVISMGFETPTQYRPYKNMNLENAAKLYKWKIKPNKLIESMSYGNMIFGQKLYFESKSMFIKAYDRLKSDCTEIVKDKWFAGIDMSENKNKCYTFVGTMIQRLDEKSFLGKEIKSGLVSGTGRRYIYVEGFEGSWMENKTKIGVIKGDGSFSYNSRDGKKVVPRGTIIFLN